jgi:membrane-anchored glycerophosphoryl diester phosphodiesterase (GDPDase)
VDFYCYHHLKLSVENDYSTAGELKIYRSFGVNFCTPVCAGKLKLVALDLFGPQVVAVQISASYNKNSDLYDSLNKVEKIAQNKFTSAKNLTGKQSIIFLALFALASCRFFYLIAVCL